jgi:hypothetical protein
MCLPGPAFAGSMSLCPCIPQQSHACICMHSCLWLSDPQAATNCSLCLPTLRAVLARPVNPAGRLGAVLGCQCRSLLCATTCHAAAPSAPSWHITWAAGQWMWACRSSACTAYERWREWMMCCMGTSISRSSSGARVQQGEDSGLGSGLWDPWPYGSPHNGVICTSSSVCVHEDAVSHFNAAGQLCVCWHSPRIQLAQHALVASG